MSQPLADARKCAVCGKPQDVRFRPFCSRRCADLDLGRWLKGGYAIPATEPPEGEEIVPEDEE
jgi:endogenous inhibitor of DNA gyrase (YacG/DUF329 family)